MYVSVIGAGYVGLVQACGLASFGHHVRLGEKDAGKVERLVAGHSPIFERGLSEMLDDGLRSGRLTVHGDNAEAVKGAAVVFIAVPTPQGADGAADLTAVYSVLDDIGDAVQDGCVIAFKSTVPVGTVAEAQRRLGDRVRVASNPEFLREGQAVTDFLNPDRIIIGVDDPAAANPLVELYGPLDAPIVVTDPTSAELAKYAANAYLATRVTFANAIANVCEAVGADVRAVLEGMGHDHRIGQYFMRPGPGYGGSCFPKDTRALVAIADSAGYDFSLLRGVIDVNEDQKRRVLGKVAAAAGGTLTGRRVAVWGLAFKAGTDDVRDSPAVWLVEQILASGGEVCIYDPHAHIDGLCRADDPVVAARDADVVLIATEWPEFADVDMRSVALAMRGDGIVDARNVLEPERVRAAGLTYRGVGR